MAEWSKRVMETSDALDIVPGTFSQNDPKRVAELLRDSAEASTRRKAGPFQSAMSMLNFYINRAGSRLSPERKEILQAAKNELRKLYGRI